jgi:hypothetical protein
VDEHKNVMADHYNLTRTYLLPFYMANSILLPIVGKLQCRNRVRIWVINFLDKPKKNAWSDLRVERVLIVEDTESQASLRLFQFYSD